MSFFDSLSAKLLTTFLSVFLSAATSLLASPARYAVDFTMRNAFGQPSYTVDGVIVVSSEGLLVSPGEGEGPMIIGYSLDVQPINAGSSWSFDYYPGLTEHFYLDNVIADNSSLYIPPTFGVFDIRDELFFNNTEQNFYVERQGSWEVQYNVFDYGGGGNGITSRSWDVPSNQDNLDIGNRLVDGDYDGDGEVTLDDYDVWVSEYGGNFQLRSSDGNGDFSVDAADYTIWRDAYSAASLSQAIPEPTALVLLLSCGLVFSASRPIV